MTQGQKIQQFIDHLELSKLGFANSIGVSASVINSIVSGTNNPGHKVLAGIKRKYPRFNTDWLLNNEGEMLLSEESKKPDPTYLEDYLQKLEGHFKALTEQSKLVADQFANQLAVKDRQLESLQKTVDILLGKYDLSESTPCENMVALYPKMAS